MVHEPVQRATVAAPDGHLQSIERKVRAHRRIESPSHNPPGEDIGYKGDVDHARPGRDIRNVSHPQCVWPIRGELALDQVSRPLGVGVRPGRAGPSAAAQGADQPFGSHEPLDRAPRHRDPFPVKLKPYLSRPVHFVILLPYAADLDKKFLIPHCAGRRWPILCRIVR